MLLNKIRISLTNINFRPEAEFCIATEVIALLDYTNPENPSIIGSKVRCLGIGNSSFDVKLVHPASKPIPINNDMITASAGVGVNVVFSDLSLSCYCFIDKQTGKLKQGVTATASKVELLEDNNNDVVM